MRIFFTLFSRIGSFFFGVKRFTEPHFIAKQIESGKIKKILLIHLQQLGDTLVFTPSAKALLERYGKQVEIDVLCNSVSYEVCKNMPHIRRFYVDKFWFWGKGEKKLSLLFKLLKDIRRERYDLAILDAEETALKYPIIAFLTGATYRLGYDVDSRGFLNNVVPTLSPSLSYVSRNKALLEFAGIPVPSTHLWLPTTASDKAQAQELLRLHCSSSTIPIMIHQGSNFSSKHWFKENWVALCKRLLENPSVILFFSGAERERHQVDAILSELNSPCAISLVGKTSIHTLKELIELCQLFITVDTGVMHIGNCTTTPMIVLMSARDYENLWIEPSERVSVLRKEVDCKYCLGIDCPTGTKECMKLIEVEEVYQEALRFLPVLAHG
jgi:lipopolysaccharide heptosyltransferase II